MGGNARRLAASFREAGYDPKPFTSSMQHSVGDGIRFEYPITDGSRAGETVWLGLVIPESVGDWPEVAPHWIHIAPPDHVLEEQVLVRGSVERYRDSEGTEWMAISAPVSDFWDQIDEPDGKNAKTYTDRHLRRIWGAR